MNAALRTQQQAFALGLVGDDPGPALAQLRPLCGQPPRLGAYRHAYRARLMAALRENYPVLQRCLGDEGFDALALGYVAVRPSTQPSIRWFGHQLAEHLASLPEDEAPHPAVIDLARMEWALSLAFDAADAPGLPHQALASLAPAHWLTHALRLHPSVQAVALGWRVEPLWQALSLDPDATAPAPEASEHCLLVWRQGLQTRWRSLGEPEAALLQAALAGLSLAQLCETAAAHMPAEQAPASVVATLQLWLADGLICDLVDSGD